MESMRRSPEDRFVSPSEHKAIYNDLMEGIRLLKIISIVITGPTVRIVVQMPAGVDHRAAQADIQGVIDRFLQDTIRLVRKHPGAAVRAG